MKKFLLALILVAACSRTATTTHTVPITPAPGKKPSAASSTRSGDRMAGAATAMGAVEEFLVAVKAQDIQAMSVLFGTSRGPARDNMDREELEKRLIILQCYFSHDKFRIVDEFPGEGGHRVISVELTKGSNTRNPKFYAIAGPSNRFYVDNMEIAAVRDFCRK